ncbi:MAG: HU family DNA-binding protein [Faecalibacterium sp.]
MTKVELIAQVAANADMTKKDAEKAVNAVIESLTDALKNGEKVAISGFGSFEVRERPEHKGRNPRTKEEITIPASRTAAFKAGKALKDVL